MSTRDYFCSFTSIDPIRDAVGSGDDALVEAVVSLRTKALKDEFGDGFDEDADDPEFRDYVESMIKCKSPPKKEPGCWNYVVEHLAKHLGLEPNLDLPFNEGWKHYDSWGPYRKLVKKHVTTESMKSLRHLQDGRPLRGKKIGHDGCLFAWLSADEVRELHDSLSQLDDTVITDADLADFHDTLVDSLQMISAESKVLFMGAH